MKSFYGRTYIGKEKLAKNNIYYPIRLEYYKTHQNKNFKTTYGIEVVKTEYRDDEVKVENKIVHNLTYEENVINRILEYFKLGEITPIVAEEMAEELLKNYV